MYIFIHPVHPVKPDRAEHTRLKYRKHNNRHTSHYEMQICLKRLIFYIFAHTHKPIYFQTILSFFFTNVTAKINSPKIYIFTNVPLRTHIPHHSSSADRLHQPLLSSSHIHAPYQANQLDILHHQDFLLVQACFLQHHPVHQT